MLFSSTEFLFWFLPLVLILYFLVSRWTAAKNLVLLCASLLFYAWGEPRFVYVMLASIVCNYIFGLLIGGAKMRAKARAKAPRAAKLALGAGVVCNLGLLFVFKYLTFALENLGSVLSLPFAVPQIALPIGISFFTFQSMSYLIDVYRDAAEVQKNPFDLALYVALFPQLIAGPIVRYETVAKQISHRRETWAGIHTGLCRFLVGLFKKVLISNQMGLVADKAFSLNGAGTLSAGMAWLGALSYALQIYYDFSGYSDMAIGLGRVFGFTFEENFDYPYISSSVTEFWRRWHISLGTWFRDYVYIPLGGSRVKTKARLVFNLAVVWISTGVWHGAAWNFLFWGVWFFVLLTVEKLCFSHQLKAAGTLPFYKKLPGWLYAMTAVLLGWVLFRAENLPLAWSYLGAMFGAGDVTGDTTALLFLSQKAVFFVAAILFSAPIVPCLKRKLDALRSSSGGALVPMVCDILYPPVMLGLFLVCVSYLLKSDYNPFIYFNF
ncbi:MAG: MBOAT family protein [Clostridia bacterium]|nr:MBOAT family protein [Clostridia bacterium]